jgi:hypothetical protein
MACITLSLFDSTGASRQNSRKRHNPAPSNRSNQTPLNRPTPPQKPDPTYQTREVIGIPNAGGRACQTREVDVPRAGGGASNPREVRHNQGGRPRPLPASHPRCQSRAPPSSTPRAILTAVDPPTPFSTVTPLRAIPEDRQRFVRKRVTGRFLRLALCKNTLFVMNHLPQQTGQHLLLVADILDNLSRSRGEALIPPE